MSNPCIYLDHHATTPVDERVFLKMKPFFLSDFGNPASVTHNFGWQAQKAVDQARQQVAQAINAHPSEIIFTSGATESTNMAIKGLFFPEFFSTKRKIISSTIEHGATLSTLDAIKSLASAVHLIKPSSDGLIEVGALQNVITDDTLLVSLFMAHNEVGSINSIKDLAAVAHQKGALFHCDAAQAFGRVKIDCQELDIDFMSLSGHKAYGPKGVGVLYIRKNLMDRICPLIHGGGQEWHKRSGTLNVPGIVGMGEAARLVVDDFIEENKRIKRLRDQLLANLRVLEGVRVNGTLEQRVSGNLNVSFEGIDGEELVLAVCQEVAFSTGSACSSGLGKKNRALLEMGVNSELRQASIRLGLGRKTTDWEIERASMLIVEAVKQQRNQTRSKKLISFVSRNDK